MAATAKTLELQAKRACVNSSDRRTVVLLQICINLDFVAGYGQIGADVHKLP
jgi:hypothetical protein